MFGQTRAKSASTAGHASELEYEGRDDYLIDLVIKLNKMHETGGQPLQTASP